MTGLTGYHQASVSEGQVDPPKGVKLQRVGICACLHDEIRSLERSLWLQQAQRMIG